MFKVTPGIGSGRVVEYTSDNKTETEGRFQQRMIQLYNQFKIGTVDSREYLAAFDSPPEPPQKARRKDTGINPVTKGKAEWIKNMEHEFRELGINWKLDKTEPTPAQNDADPHYYNLGLQARAGVDLMDAQARTEPGEQHVFVDVYNGYDRMVQHTNVTPTLATRSIVWNRSTREILSPTHHFALQGYDLARHFPQSVDFEKTDLLHFSGDALPTVLAQVSLLMTLLIVPLV